MKDYIKQLEKRVEKMRKENTEYHSYSGDDCFVYDGAALFSVNDFWKYHYSHLLGESGVLAEFFVAQALGISKAENVLYWTAYDMSYRNKRIEVKATAYIHPWNKTGISQRLTFSIAPSGDEYWDEQTCTNEKRYSRQSDVYIFCVDENKNLDDINPLRIDSWKFYVVPTYKIDLYANPMQKTIAMSIVRDFCRRPVSYAELREAVDAAIDENDSFHRMKFE